MDTDNKRVHCVPRYTINLDLDPSERWNQVVDDYKEKWLAVDAYAVDMIKSVIGPTLGPAVDLVIRNLLKSFAGKVHYSKEMKAIAKRAKMDLGRLVLLQHIYEASACCTSIVVNGSDGYPLHIRCMDWAMDVLEPLTIECDFTRNGNTVFVATTWAGYIGIFTGMRPGAWSCSLNFRVTTEGTFWKNLSSAVSGSWPSGFLIRHLLETESDYNNVVNQLATTPLVAPCYFTVCGIRPNEGTLITRGPKVEETRWILEEKGTIVQTNIDHWSFENSEDVMQSIARRELGFRLLDKMPQPVTYTWLWELISSPPILNDITIYATLMVPMKGILQTRLPQGRHGFKPIRNAVPKPHVKLVDPELSFEDIVKSITVPEVPPHICTECGTSFGPYINPKGECKHSKPFHATYADCNYAKCAIGLGPSGIGKQHWGCCYSFEPDSTVCPKSPGHVAPQQTP